MSAPNINDSPRGVARSSQQRMVSLLRVAVAPNGRGVAEIKTPRWWKNAHPDRKHKYLHAKFGRLGWWRFDDVEQANDKASNREE